MLTKDSRSYGAITKQVIEITPKHVIPGGKVLFDEERSCPYPLCPDKFKDFNNVKRHGTTKSSHLQHYKQQREKLPTYVVGFINLTLLMDQCPFCCDWPMWYNIKHMEGHIETRQHGTPTQNKNKSWV